MLSRFPFEFGRYCDTSKAIAFYAYLGFLTDAILEACPKPWVDVTRNINSRCGDEIVPKDVSMPVLWYIMMADYTYHEVRV
jgi:hypothetical protein